MMVLLNTNEPIKRSLPPSFKTIVMFKFQIQNVFNAFSMSFQTHLQTCDQKVIPCPNNNCHMKMERRRLEDHTLNKCQWRLVCCVHCGEQNAKCNEEVMIC